MTTESPTDTSTAPSMTFGFLSSPEVGVPSRQVVPAFCLVGLAAGLAANSVAGPLLVDSIDYPVSDSMRNQTIGLDAAALFLFAPALIITAVLAYRGHQLWSPLTVSLGAYVSYIFMQYLVGPEFERYPASLLLHLGLFIGGWMLAAIGWQAGRRNRSGTAEDLSPHHALAVYFMAAFVILRYLPGLAASLTGGSLPEELRGDITMYWLIVVSDLGVFIPIAMVTAAGIRRGAAWGRLALTATVGWFTLVSIAVGAMSFTMIVNDDRYASNAQLGMFIITTILASSYAVHLYRALLDRPETRTKRYRGTPTA